MGSASIRILGAAASVAFLVAFNMPAQATLLFDQDVKSAVIFGTGNTNGGFTVDRNGGVELGLRARIPFAGITNSNGDGSYTYTFAEENAVPAGSIPGGPAWGFNWTVNTNFDSSTGNMISAFTYELKIDFDPGLGTNFLAGDPITTPFPSPLPSGFFPDNSFGDNTTPMSGGAEAATLAEYNSFTSSKNVVQNSSRLSFFAALGPPYSDYDPLVAGTYDIVLTAFDGNNVAVASTQIQVNIIPEPGTLALFAFGLIGLVVLKRRRMTIARLA